MLVDQGNDEPTLSGALFEIPRMVIKKGILGHLKPRLTQCDPATVYVVQQTHMKGGWRRFGVFLSIWYKGGTGRHECPVAIILNKGSAET